MTDSWFGWINRITDRWGGTGASALLDPAALKSLATWRELPEPARDEPLLATRFVVVDVETSGLDLHADSLIAIGAVEVEGAKISLNRGFHVVLRQSQASTDENILVHRIGGTTQMQGKEPVEALLEFLGFAGKAPLVGYHAAFDERMIGKTMRKMLGERFRRQWIDLAALAPALYPAVAPRMKGLDDWCREFGIKNLARHDALADALATAQLLQVLLHQASARGIRGWDALAEAARAQAWLDRARR
jgi:DNA polymerase III subunit epsilon